MSTSGMERRNLLGVYDDNVPPVLGSRCNVRATRAAKAFKCATRVMVDGNALRQVRTRELPLRRMQLWLKMARGTYDERGRMCWMIARCRPRSHV